TRSTRHQGSGCQRREQNLMALVLISCILPAEEADVGFSASCLTTAELQQHWRAVKQEFRSVKLLFDISTARIIDQQITKYVVYQIVVIRSGSYDCERVAIERRYSDFLHLHQELLPQIMVCPSISIYEYIFVSIRYLFMF
uniref:PX domain-containing protein n=1 Tax=Sinocyclocheilus anshuiensis TaxID=1608454 RepID=A0A671LGD5_9TELE